ncbi:MAG: PAS domain-containing protein [Bacteroidetes bacterium]|nr:PAS domain-containing protein [Bacteroidota bacterium]
MNNTPNGSFKKNTPLPFEARWIRKDGRIIWIETINRPMFDNEGRLVAVVCW